MGLFSNHVVVTESLLSLVLQSLEGCRGGKLKLRDGPVKIGEVPIPDQQAPAESEDPREAQSAHTLQSRLNTAGRAQRRTFLNTDRTMRLHPVTKSTGTASNPVPTIPSVNRVNVNRPASGRSASAAWVEV